MMDTNSDSKSGAAAAAVAASGSSSSMQRDRTVSQTSSQRRRSSLQALLNRRGSFGRVAPSPTPDYDDDDDGGRSFTHLPRSGSSSSSSPPNNRRRSISSPYDVHSGRSGTPGSTGAAAWSPEPAQKAHASSPVGRRKMYELPEIRHHRGSGGAQSTASDPGWAQRDPGSLGGSQRALLQGRPGSGAASARPARSSRRHSRGGGGGGRGSGFFSDAGGEDDTGGAAGANGGGDDVGGGAGAAPEGETESERRARLQEEQSRMVQRWGANSSVRHAIDASSRAAFLLSPTSNFMRRWDTVTMVALLYVAVVTPFELAFLNPAPTDPIFILNRLLDFIFTADLIMTFFLSYRDSETLLWVYDLKLIAKRYLRTWFLIDFLSVLPFDLISIMFHSDSLSQLQLVRVLRVAKLFKLARILRLTRINARWEKDLAVPFATIALIKFAVYMITMTHWFACLWGLVAVTETAEAETQYGAPTMDTSWLQMFGYDQEPVSTQYLAAVHWAMQTVSTVGYGDIRATTTPERLVSVFCMAYGASTWAYVVASVCGIVTSLDPHGTHRKHTMAEVNEFMMTKSLPKTWRPRLRGFFIARENYQRTVKSQALMRKMSPMLKAEVSYFLNKDWILRVPYLAGCSKNLVTDVAMVLDQEFYAPEEEVTSATLHILQRGMCMQGGRVIPVGFVWGEDMILTNPELRNLTTVFTLTHTHLYKLDRATFMHLLTYFPTDYARITSHANWLTVQRKIVHIVRTLKREGRDIGEGFADIVGAAIAKRKQQAAASAVTEARRSARSSTSGAALVVGGHEGYALFNTGGGTGGTGAI